MHLLNMTEIGELNSTDKVGHGYTKLYDELFMHMRYTPVRILEIGFWRGRSARMFLEYFPRSVVHEVDIAPKWDCYERIPKSLRKRLKVWVADQGSPESLKMMLNDIAKSPPNKDKRGVKPFDIILDDGSHDPKNQLTAFDVLWPQVAEGGFYVIEDLHCAYSNDNSAVVGRHPTVDYFFSKVHEVNKHGVKKAKPITDISWITFARNLVIVRKQFGEE